MLHMVVYFAPSLETMKSYDEFASALVDEVKMIFGMEADEDVALTAVRAAFVSVGAAEVQIEFCHQESFEESILLPANIARRLIDVTKKWFRAYPRISVSVLIHQGDAYFRINRG